MVIDTGTTPSDEGYSGFENPMLRELLREEQVGAVTIVGLATDVCVLHTAAGRPARGAAGDGRAPTPSAGSTPTTPAPRWTSLSAAGALVV